MFETIILVSYVNIFMLIHFCHKSDKPPSVLSAYGFNFEHVHVKDYRYLYICKTAFSTAFSCVCFLFFILANCKMHRNNKLFLYAHRLQTQSHQMALSVYLYSCALHTWFRTEEDFNINKC